MDWLIILQAVWFILPAYIANMTPPLLSKIKFIQGFNKPMDFGRNFSDGKRIFGEGKTWLGFILGIICGTIFGFAQSFAAFEPKMSLLLAFLLSSGGLTGDLVKSFFKRRVGLERGKSWPVMDQLDFVVAAFAFSLFVFPFNWKYFLVVIVLTPILHLVTNIIGWKLGFKKEPW